MNSFQARIGKFKFDGIDNAYVLTSAWLGEGESGYPLRVTFTFFYDAGEYAAEWEPRWGPIQVWRKCGADAEGAKPHHFYDYTNSPVGNWSQRAVEREGLHEAFLDGNYRHIFNVLKEWAESNEQA